jgi:hypothetical protein
LKAFMKSVRVTQSSLKSSCLAITSSAVSPETRRRSGTI